MNSRATERFWQLFEELPGEVRTQARNAFKQFEDDPFHPGLKFKNVTTRRPSWSVRITRDYRAPGIRDGDQITWIWVGSHADYDHEIKHSR
ncbi:MAG: hypothetical protein ACRDG3_12700 [Tepidiformaceae bacterium]